MGTCINSVSNVQSYQVICAVHLTYINGLKNIQTCKKSRKDVSMYN